MGGLSNVLMIISLLLTLNEAVSNANSVTGTSPMNVLVGTDATIEWTIKADVGQRYMVAILYDQATDKELWNNFLTNDASTPQDDRLKDLAPIYGNRVSISTETVLSETTITLSISKINFTDSKIFKLQAGFGDGTTLFGGVEQRINKTIELKVVAPKPDNRESGPKSDSNTGTIVGIVLGVIVLIVIIAVIVFLYKRRGGRHHNKHRSSEDDDFVYTKEQPGNGEYAPVGTGVPQYAPSEQKPPTEKYAQLGPGGRNGPKDPVVRSNYAEAKVDYGDNDNDENRYSSYSGDHQISDSVIV